MNVCKESDDPLTLLYNLSSIHNFYDERGLSVLDMFTELVAVLQLRRSCVTLLGDMYGIPTINQIILLLTMSHRAISK